jgi:ATP-binding cassette subfamily B protein RaxB
MQAKRIVRQFWRPAVEPQTEPADCGYVCIAALSALYGRPIRVAQIKSEVGWTSRGLTLRQVRDALTTIGIPAAAIAFNTKSAKAYPAPGVVLLQRGHYIVTRRARTKAVEVFDPRFGWTWLPLKRLARQANGLGVTTQQPTAPPEPKSGTIEPKSGRLLAYFRHYLGVLGVWAIVLACAAQILALGLPLVSKLAIDNLVRLPGHSPSTFIVAAFSMIAIVGAITNFAGATVNGVVKRKALNSFSRSMFDNFAAKPFEWFNAIRPAAVQAQLSAVESQLSFAGEVFKAAGTTVISIIAGIIVLFKISPWLAVPGFVGLSLSIMIELAFNRTQSSHLAASFEASQERQTFNLEVLAQMPMLARFGSVARGRTRYAIAVSRIAEVEFKLARIRNIRDLAETFIKSAETLAFVSVAALFISSDGRALGSFVALAAYKDLLSQAIASLFQLRQRHRAMEVERLITEDFQPQLRFDPPPPRTIERGVVEVQGMSFRYGALDSEVLSEVTLRVSAGECLVIKGGSGCGKSTLVKLVCGLLEPTSGRVLVDGAAPAHPMAGFASVLQSDRLLPGSLRDNVAVFRRGIGDEKIYEALGIADLEDFVRKLPMRLNTQVGESLGGLSGGQRQRILLARALLGRPKLLVLDEATASLDVESEQRIVMAIKATGMTLIIVSHRPEVWRLGDRVVDFVGGTFRDVEHQEALWGVPNTIALSAAE